MMNDEFKEIILTRGKVALVDDDVYNEENKHRWCTYHQGSGKNSRWYAMRNDCSTGKKKNMRMHRFIWELVNGPIPEGFQIDHIDHNGLDNRLENLRLATSAEEICSMSVKNEYMLVKSQAPTIEVFVGINNVINGRLRYK